MAAVRLIHFAEVDGRNGARGRVTQLVVGEVAWHGCCIFTRSLYATMYTS
jgi:hypothetical protein